MTFIEVRELKGEKINLLLPKVFKRCTPIEEMAEKIGCSYTLLGDIINGQAKDISNQTLDQILVRLQELDK